MASIADLFVRVRGDTGDVTTKLKGVEGSISSVGRSAEAGHLSVNKMTRAFETLIVQTLGVNREIAVLGTVLADFAVGGVVVAGVVGGLALIGAAYHNLTEDARKLREEQDKLVKSLSSENFTASLGPAPDLVLQTNAQRNLLRQQQDRRRVLLNFGVSPDDQRILDLNRDIANSQRELEAGEKRLFDARMKATTPLDTVVTKARDYTAEMEKQQRLLIQYQELMARSYGTWGTSSNFTANPVPFAGNQFQMDLQSLLADAQPRRFVDEKGNVSFISSASTVDISDSVKLAGDNAKKINDAAKKNSDQLRDAIWGSAAALANSVVSALNLGGGGRGSSLGGALGGTAGFAAGFVFGGPIGGAIGSTLGNIAGSLLGGLFDHKKAIETNTAAVRQNTAALLLNSPNVYKVAQGRFDATDVKALRNAAQRYATRGGAPVFVTP